MVRVEPSGRGIAELAGDDGRIKGGDLVEADHGRNGTLRPVPGAGVIATISGPVRGMEVTKHTTKSVRQWLLCEMTRAGRRLSPDRSVNGKRVRTMLPKANT